MFNIELPSAMSRYLANCFVTCYTYLFKEKENY